MCPIAAPGPQRLIYLAAKSRSYSTACPHRSNIFDLAGCVRWPLQRPCGSKLCLTFPRWAIFLPGYDASQWYAIGLRKSTSMGIIDILNKEINTALAEPKLMARLADLGTTVFPGTSAEYGRIVAEETEKWAKVIRAANIKLG
jgi:hypothetical protein